MKIKTIIKVLALLGPLATFAPQDYETGLGVLAKLTTYEFLSAENKKVVDDFAKNKVLPLVTGGSHIGQIIKTEKDGLESIYTDAMQFSAGTSKNSIIFILQLREIPTSLQEFYKLNEWEQRKDFVENLKRIDEKKSISNITDGIREQKISDLSLLIRILKLFGLGQEDPIGQNPTEHLTLELHKYLDSPNKKRSKEAQLKALVCFALGSFTGIITLSAFILQTNNSIPGIPTNSTLNNIPALKAMWCLTWPLKPEQCLGLYIGETFAAAFFCVSCCFYFASCLYKCKKITKISENDKKLFAQLAALHALQNEEKYLQDSSRCNKLASRICSCITNCYNKMSCLIRCKSSGWNLCPADCGALNPCEKIPIHELVEAVALDQSPRDRLIKSLNEDPTNSVEEMI